VTVEAEQTAMSGDDVRSSAPVRRWLSSAGHDTQPEQVQERYLSLLEHFCSHVDKTPDELVAYCFLKKKDTGERFVSVQRRTTVNAWIDEFVQARGWTGKDAVANANVVRGFLIHNGVLIQGKVWTGP
jgi:hypothetical protein